MFQVYSVQVRVLFPHQLFFLPISEVIGFDSMSIPRLNRFFAPTLAKPSAILLKKLPSFCLALYFLYFPAIFLAACLAREAKTTLCCSCLVFVRCCLGPIVLFRVTATFNGTPFLLILSYIAMKDDPFGKFTTYGVARRRNSMFSFIFFLLFSHQKFY